ncbi:MAG: HU family DNA-binding protein [Bacilli bacterium]|nr:HU family DNA-binding protein [Bacilli bacterium]MBR0301619.1 HU family DNA-binding protein [Bacilli bacterium]
MNKAELIVELAEKLDLPRNDVTAVIDEFLDIVETNVQKGEVVKLSNFGVFYKKDRKARRGTNPGDGHIITIPANSTLGFRPSKIVRGKLN